MKYAFILGSNAFIVPSSVITYSNGSEEKEFLRINALHRDIRLDSGDTFLDIDLNINDTDGNPVTLLSNKPVNNFPYTIEKDTHAIKLIRADGTMLIRVLLLDEEDAAGLEHNIVAELEVHAPTTVIRITGDFKLGDIHIDAENEKLYVNDNGYATSAMIGTHRLTFTPEGVEL